jgi:ubiquinone/menaquinone biosynthesis C-methylase UbiE
MYAFLLEINLEQKGIDFEYRLVELSRTKSPLRVLSLCSGSARIEAGFDELTNYSCLWTLQDINDELLQKARGQFAPMASVEFLVGDVNLIHQMDREWDIIMCVSGLHHIVELESVTDFVYQSLSPSGEFWLLGEYVGNSGNRLNPSAQIAADNVFRELPEKYRFNQHTKRFDSTIPKNDYSIDCFEGIRADQIEKIISRRFATQSISRNNSFLWRFVNLAYANNYDLKKIEDMQVLEKLVRAELSHFNKVHDGTTLNAIYTKF